MSMTARRFTVADYHRMGEVGILGPEDRVELLEGEVIEMSPIGGSHADCVDRLNGLFATRLASRACVRVQNPVTLEEHNEPQPDIALVRLRPEGYGPGHPGPADIHLLIEVADSSLEYDRREKLPVYASLEVRECWLVDLTRRLIEVHRKPGASGYSGVRSYRRGESLAPEAFPDCVIAVSDIVG